MATPKVLSAVTPAWVDVAGSAASVAGVTWQNLGTNAIKIAFSATSPSTATPYNTLLPNQAFYDKNGSAKVWVKSGGTGSTISGVAD